MRFDQVQAEKAIFEFTDLRGCMIASSRLCGADFSYANLAATRLAQVDLTGVNLHCATTTDSRWELVNLTNVKRTDPVRLRGETWMPPPP